MVVESVDRNLRHDPSDEELIGMLRAGDTDSLGILVARWEVPLYRFVYRLMPRREEAQDICQETFLRVLKKSDRFREGGKFSTWLYHIALNLCRDHRRKRRRWRSVLLEGGFEEDRAPAVRAERSGSDAPDESLARAEIRRVVSRALDTLPAEQREVLILKEFEGLKFREIAEIVGSPESTVKSRMYHGLRSLKAALNRGGYSPPRDDDS